MVEAQARLVAFLHERLGFSVLAWEAGLTLRPPPEAGSERAGPR
jgi:hypothetical protein